MPASRLSLDGTWEFLHVSDDRPSGPASVRAINVPAPWQAQFADLRMRAGIGIYRRLVDIPAEWLTDHVWLRFGADKSNQPRSCDRAVGDSLNTSGAFSRCRVSAVETSLRHTSDRERATR